MSQYMICRSEANLSKVGGILLNLTEENNTLIYSILEKYYPEKQYDEIWDIEMEKYCCKQMDHDDFIASDLYRILNGLYDLCEWMFFWYSDDFDDLDEVYSKEELISYVWHRIEVPVVNYM